MDQVEQLLTETITGLGDNSGRFEIIDYLHIHDTKTGLKYHMYDNPKPFHITMFDTEQEIAHMGDFIDNPEHMKLFKELKTKLIKLYEPVAQMNRENLVSIYNTPSDPPK